MDNTAHAEHDYGSWPPQFGFAGGLAFWFASDSFPVVISNCRISGNQVTSDPSYPFQDGEGGGIYIGPGQVSVINTMITENAAPKSGAIYGQFTLLGCTVTANETISKCDSCGAARMWGTFMNGIIHGNVNGDLGSPFGPTVLYSNVDTMNGLPFPGEGNINTDPLFVDPDNGDYHLSIDSPCVDAGDPEFVPQEGETDIDGQPRLVGERVDMGADEFLITCAADLDGNGEVGPFDLALLLGNWGSCDDPAGCPADLDDDGVVGPFDLALLLGGWGPCE